MTARKSFDDELLSCTALLCAAFGADAFGADSFGADSFGADAFDADAFAGAGDDCGLLINCHSSSITLLIRE